LCSPSRALDNAAVSTTIPVRNPGTGAHVAEVPTTSPADVSAAFARARAAQPAWAGLPVSTRAARLRAFGKELVDDPALADVLMSETGKCRFEAEGFDVFYLGQLMHFMTGGRARRALADEVRHPFMFPNKRARIVKHPRGVVGVIGPWNFPLLNNFADAVAPLVAGNAVVLKPSPVTPLTSLHVARRWREEGLPDGVLQVVNGGAEVGAQVVDEADMIFFTGSQATGRRVAARAGERLIPCVLELGGKSPFIVLADADLEAAARAAVWSAFAGAGQTCIRAERIIVEECVADELERLLLRETQALRQGVDRSRDRTQIDVDVGATIFPPQLVVLERQLADALARGARLAAGGARRPDLPGDYFQPTLLLGVTPDMAVAREETFGPLLPVLRARDATHAVALANATGLGLAGSVFSRDGARAAALARGIKSGNVAINDVSIVQYACVEAPLGGWQASGLGHRHGAEALRQFCQEQTILEDAPILGRLGPFVRSAFTNFPYTTTKLRWLRRLLRWLF
jgi:acyl-CoA reductase-like NAD-dependent aldehyde dehydrogenase